MTLHLPTLAEQGAKTRGVAIPKGATKLQVSTKADAFQKKADEMFRSLVFKRDKGLCRCCGRKVERTLTVQNNRAEAHHMAGKEGPLRHLVRAGLLLCLQCHQKVTGKVNEKVLVVGTKFFVFKGQRLIDGKAPVTFRKVA